MKTKPVSLHDVRRAIIDHVSRYRLTVFEAVRGLPSVSHVGTGTLRKQLKWLVKKGVLCQTDLLNTRPCFYFSPHRGASDGGSSARPAVFSEPAKLYCYAMLTFCRLTQTPRVRLHASELSAICPELSRPGVRRNYYVEETPNTNRLGYVHIDSGGYGRWDRIVARVRHSIDYHRGFMQLHRLMAEQHFEFAIVTTFPQKADRIHDALRSRHDLHGVSLRVCVVPELLYLIAPPPLLPGRDSRHDALTIPSKRVLFRSRPRSMEKQRDTSAFCQP